MSHDGQLGDFSALIANRTNDLKRRISDSIVSDQCALGHSFLTFGPEFHMYTCMQAFTRRMASHHAVKVHDVTASTAHYSISVTHENKIAYFIRVPVQK